MEFTEGPEPYEILIVGLSSGVSKINMGHKDRGRLKGRVPDRTA
jgi:hypothetical protein